MTGKRQNFLIEIKDRQNMTWQGSVTWLEKQETRPFRSAMELLKLLDSAVPIKEEDDVTSCDGG